MLWQYSTAPDWLSAGKSKDLGIQREFVRSAKPIDAHNENARNIIFFIQYLFADLLVYILDFVNIPVEN
jgi:hypothetical protein